MIHHFMVMSACGTSFSISLSSEGIVFGMGIFQTGELCEVFKFPIQITISERVKYIAAQENYAVAVSGVVKQVTLIHS